MGRWEAKRMNSVSGPLNLNSNYGRCYIEYQKLRNGIQKIRGYIFKLKNHSIDLIVKTQGKAKSSQTKVLITRENDEIIILYKLVREMEGLMKTEKKHSEFMERVRLPMLGGGRNKVVG